MRFMWIILNIVVLLVLVDVVCVFVYAHQNLYISEYLELGLRRMLFWPLLD